MNQRPRDNQRDDTIVMMGVNQNERTDYTALARRLVEQQIIDDWDVVFDKKYPKVFDTYVVWFCKTLQNWKAIVSTTLPDGALYEVTHNGDLRETYIDTYRKQDNRKILDSEI